MTAAEAGARAVSDVTLSPAEIEKITGKTQPAAQLRHLRRMGIRAYRRTDAEGTVCVLWAWLAANDERGAKSQPRLKSDRKSA